MDSRVAVYNRTVSKGGRVSRQGGPGHPKIIGAHSIEELVGDALATPPSGFMLMVSEPGKPVDELIDHLLPHLAPGDIIIDGRQLELSGHPSAAPPYVESKGAAFTSGNRAVSGGEEGARRGPVHPCPGDRPPGPWAARQAHLSGHRRQG